MTKLEFEDRTKERRYWARLGPNQGIALAVYLSTEKGKLAALRQTHADQLDVINEACGNYNHLNTVDI